jgi:FMN reductase
MSYADIVLIAGSPSAQSRSSRVLRELEERWRKAGRATRLFGAQDFSAEDLLLARTGAAQITAFIQTVQAAKAVVLGTPVYKAVYSGLLKTIVDLIPPEALRGKVALAVATGKLETHAPSVTAAFEGLFEFFAVGHVLPTLYLLDEQLVAEQDRLHLAATASTRVDAAAGALATALTN